MLPGPSFSIERGEFSLELVPDANQSKLPFFVRLHPSQCTIPETIRERRGGGVAVGMGVPFPQGTLDAKAGGKIERELETIRQSVTISSWGAAEQTAGWRFHSTKAQSINTNITGLSALVAIPENRKVRGNFHATAKLRNNFEGIVKGVLFQPPPGISIDYQFP
jgi:hypothetical protein